jgi:hypothetical protein
MKHKIRILWSIILLVIVSVVSAPSIVFAYSATEYHTSQSFSIGTLIALDNKEQPIAATTGDNYIGIVTSQSNGEVVVAYSGVIPVYVSDRDESIANGSKIGLSTIAGVGTLWQSNSEQIGVATESIGSASSKWQTVAATTNGGKSQNNIKVAQIMVRLTQTSNTTNNFASALVGTLQQAASGLAGHSVALWQIVVAALVGIGGLILAFGLVISSGHQSLLSLGRNPMASKVILRGMWRIVATSITIMLVGIFLAYIILKVGSV